MCRVGRVKIYRRQEGGLHSGYTVGRREGGSVQGGERQYLSPTRRRPAQRIHSMHIKGSVEYARTHAPPLHTRLHVIVDACRVVGTRPAHMRLAVAPLQAPPLNPNHPLHPVRVHTSRIFCAIPAHMRLACMLLLPLTNTKPCLYESTQAALSVPSQHTCAWPSPGCTDRPMGSPGATEPSHLRYKHEQYNSAARGYGAGAGCSPRSPLDVGEVSTFSPLAPCASQST